MKSLKIVFYKISKHLGLFKLAQFWTKEELRILCYHGLATYDEISTHSDIFMNAAKFEQRLKIIKAMNFSVLGLSEALEKLANKNISGPSVVITFDDGFKDNFTIGLPLLVKYKIPATIYVATYYVDHQGPVFGLMLQWIFRKTKKSCLEIEKMKSSFMFETLEERNLVANKIKLWGESELSHQDRMNLLAALGEQLDVPYKEANMRKMFYFLKPEEIIQLSSAGINIELHTHRHTRCLDGVDLEKEIHDNKLSLSNLLIWPPTHFCYPSGVWSKNEASILQHLGIRSAVTCDTGLNSYKTPLFELKRFLDSESCSDIEFEAELSGFAECLRRIAGIKRSGKDY